MAVLPTPDSVTLPKLVAPTAKETDPVGGFVPEAAVTVAVTKVLVPMLMLLGAATAVVVVAICTELLHRLTRLFTSTEPSPVAWSYPGPALKPMSPVVQSELPITHGTMLFPAVTSWKIPDVVCAKRYSAGLIFPNPERESVPLVTKY